MAIDPTLEVEEKVEVVEEDKEQPKTPEKKQEEGDGEESSGAVPPSPDPYYPPIIYLPEVVVNSGEEEEEEMFKRRAKLYRYAHEESPAEWKERGTGEVKIMKHPETGSARIIMRREKTMKMCANHSILPWMDLKPNCGSQKAWVWKTQADFADALNEEDKPKQETLAIRFATIDNAKAFETVFLEARQYVLEKQAKRIEDREEERGEADGEEGEEKSPADDASKDAEVTADEEKEAAEVIAAEEKEAAEEQEGLEKLKEELENLAV